MKALRIIGIIILILVVLFFVVALFLPKSSHMEDSIVINKPSALVFKQVNNFKNWSSWSPWQKADPQMKNTYEGPDLGIGAKTIWASTVNGNGSMTIIESEPYSRIVMDLKMMEQEKNSTTSFAFDGNANTTKVTWAVDIPKLTYPVERYIGLIMPGMMKKYFDNGLNKLKTLAEAMPDPPSITQVQLKVENIISITDSCKWSDIGMKMGQMYPELMSYLKSKKIQPAGAPFTIYHKWDTENQSAVFEAGFPVAQAVPGMDKVKFRALAATNAIKGTHFGAYDKTAYLYNALDEYIKEYRLQGTGGPMEVYVVNQMNEPDTAKWQTDIYFPIK
jgi:effector-binding domain-containing protein